MDTNVSGDSPFLITNRIIFMAYPKPDITTEADIKLLVDSSYNKVNQDARLSAVFNDHSKVDWEKHLPIMYRFWSSILLGSASYNGQPFPKHAFLPVEKAHFDRWMELFVENVEEQFEGPIAEMSKARALNMARVFQLKLGLLNRPPDPFNLVEPSKPEPK